MKWSASRAIGSPDTSRQHAEAADGMGVMESMSSDSVVTRKRESPPWLIALVASAGGIRAIRTILGRLPADLPATIVIVQHRAPYRKSYLPAILARSSRLPVRVAEHGDLMEDGVYIARPDFHLLIGRDGRFLYEDGRPIRFIHSSANPLLESAARLFGERVIAVVLTGMGADGTDGVQTVKAHGGLVIAQDKATSEYWSMPESALKSGAVDYVLPLEAIAPALIDITEGRRVSQSLETV